MWEFTLFTVVALCTSRASGAATNPESQLPPISVQYQAQNNDGHYKFGYATLDGQYRVEEGSASDVVIGSYGYPSPDGRYIRVFYKADKNGFQILNPPDSDRTNPLGQAHPLGFPAQPQLNRFIHDVTSPTTTATTSTTPTTTTTTTEVSSTSTEATTTVKQEIEVPAMDNYVHDFPFVNQLPLQLPPPLLFFEPRRGSRRKMIILYNQPPVHYFQPRLHFQHPLLPFPFARLPHSKR